MDPANDKFTRAFLRVMEPLVFARRLLTLAVLGGSTVFLGYQASSLQRDAGFEKQLPVDHEYMQVFKKYQGDFGSANRVLTAVVQRQGDIYDVAFMETLRGVTEEVFFVPGVNRAHVSSLFTPDVGYTEVTERGFEWGNVVPAEYSPTEEVVARIRANVSKATVVGRLVSLDHRGAMVWAELVEQDPASGEKLDYVDVAAQLEDVRSRFTSAQMYELRLIRDHPPQRKGDVVGSVYRPLDTFRTVTVTGKDASGEAQRWTFRHADLAATAVPNPDYNPNVDVHIIGFAKVVGDVSEAATEVTAFFGVTLIITLVLLWMYCGSFGIALLPLGCALIAVIWELGLLRLFGFGLDPYAVLVPFLVLSLAVSHGVQITNFWLYEITEHGSSAFDASRNTFRRLVVPGLTALLTNIVGFATILLVPVEVIREMAWNACFGCFAIIVSKKVLLPIALSYVPLPDPHRLRDYQRRRDALFDGLWARLAAITQKPWAVVVLVAAFGVLLGSLWQARGLTIGEVSAGAPELKADSRYNRDAAAISAGFVTGLDVLKVIAEAHPDACVEHSVMETIGTFAWHMTNTPGVLRVSSLAQTAAYGHKAINEDNPRWKVLPRNRFVLAQVTGASTASGLLNGDCSAMPVVVYLRDHKAETIARVVDAAKRFHAALPADGPVKFALASGNVGVLAASNEVIRSTERSMVLWVYAAIAICVWLSFRTFASVVCVLLPLALISVLAYAMMAVLGIGLKIATLPVAAFAAGIGVDYGIYIYSVLEEHVRRGISLRDAYHNTLRQTGKAVMFTGLALGAGTGMWIFSGLQFQVDMGLLLTSMFLANMLSALLILPALAAFAIRPTLAQAERSRP